MRPLSLSGLEIDGQSPVWFVYADESGISVHDPILVVAGVIIHADSQWILTEQSIHELMNKYASSRGFVSSRFAARSRSTVSVTD